KEVTGQVVRVNKVRDVALVKLERDVYPYLLLGNTAMVNVGEEVFSIGTPLSEDLSQTVTKGIVSSFRVKEDVKYVQSDVNIHPGNSGGPLVSLNKGVIGVCVSGITFGPYTLGLNYFIPVEEAIKALRITKDVS
ncbi:MAG: S1C family serine protease, partial [Syntrophorhabdales bacterium]